MKQIFVFFSLILFSLFLFAEEDDDDKLKLAVMEFEDSSGKLSPETLAGATEYMRGAFVSTNKYVVIAKERQEKAMIKEMKKESYKSCNDKNCQIPLGQALSADTILRTTITFFGGSYTITSELIDLAKEATVVGATEDYDGSETALKAALNSIVKKIAGTVKVQEVKPETKNDEKEKEEKIKAEEEKRKAEEAGKIRDELNQAGRKKRLAIATSTLAAGVVVGALGGVSFYGMSKAESDRKKYYDRYLSATENAADLWNKSRNADKKRKTYMILGGVGVGVGVALIATGITFYSMEFEGEKEVKKKYNLSFGASPMDGTIQFALNW